MKLIAKRINKDFLIVQSNGRKVGNIRIAPQGVFLNLAKRTEQFARLEDMTAKYHIEVTKAPSAHKNIVSDCLGYPTNKPVHNPEWGVKMGLPLFTTIEKSRSKRCAGYYLVERGDEVEEVFCPKLIVLKRNNYLGPFSSENEMAIAKNKYMSESPQSNNISAEENCA